MYYLSIFLSEISRCDAWYQNNHKNIVGLTKMFPYFEIFISTPQKYFASATLYFCDDNSGAVASFELFKLQGLKVGIACFWNSRRRNWITIKYNI